MLDASRRPKSLLRVLVLATAVGAAACSGSGADNQPPAASSSPTPAASATPTPSASAAPTPTPTPVPTPTPTPSVVSAMDCLNPELFRIGVREQRSTEFDNDSMFSYSTADFDAVVMQETDIDGATAMERKTLYTMTPRDPKFSPVERQRLDYVKLSEDGTRVLIYGYEDESAQCSDDNCGLTSARYHEPLVFRYDVQPGDEYEQSFGMTFTREGPCLAVGSCPARGNPYTGSATQTIRYLGRELIEVPAGQFETCKFEVVRLGDGPGPNSVYYYQSTLWLGVGNGLVVRQESDPYMGRYDVGPMIELLVNAAIDGEPVVGN
jgi:hypothetical protein